MYNWLSKLEIKLKVDFLKKLVYNWSDETYIRGSMRKAVGEDAFDFSDDDD